LFTSPLFSPPKDVEIWCSPNPLKYSFPKIFYHDGVFNLAKNTLEWRRFVEISRDYPLKTRTSKQPIGEIPGYKIIPLNTLEVNKA
jgi:hypothetical protein